MIFPFFPVTFLPFASTALAFNVYFLLYVAFSVPFTVWPFSVIVTFFAFRTAGVFDGCDGFVVPVLGFVVPVLGFVVSVPGFTVP